MVIRRFNFQHYHNEKGEKLQKTKTSQLWLYDGSVLTYRREVLVLVFTREEDDRMGRTRRKHDMKHWTKTHK